MQADGVARLMLSIPWRAEILETWRVIFPVVGEQAFEALVCEARALGTAPTTPVAAHEIPSESVGGFIYTGGTIVQTVRSPAWPDVHGPP